MSDLFHNPINSLHVCRVGPIFRIHVAFPGDRRVNPFRIDFACCFVSRPPWPPCRTGITGMVLIDGVNCSILGLRTLRVALGYIPQDPILLSGDLRFNLDPTGIEISCLRSRAIFIEFQDAYDANVIFHYLQGKQLHNCLMPNGGRVAHPQGLLVTHKQTHWGFKHWGPQGQTTRKKNNHIV